MPYRQTTVAGLPAIALYNDALELIALPGVGARITHLRRRAGREWLWRNPALPFRVPPAAPPAAVDAYLTGYDSGGWDECFPTIAPGTLIGATPRALTDHGELWYASWEHDLLASAEATTWRSSTTCHGVAAAFSREVSVGRDDATVVSLHYQLRSLETTPVPYLWSAHPLLGIQPGMRLAVGGMSRARVASVHGRDDWRVGEELSWPPDGGAEFEIPAKGGWAAKLFFVVEDRPEVRLSDPTRRESLVLNWDAGEIPALGVWLNCGGWSGVGAPYWNVGLEPCLAPIEGVVTGITGAELAPILPPQGQRSWRVTVTLREGPF